MREMWRMQTFGYWHASLVWGSVRLPFPKMEPPKWGFFLSYGKDLVHMALWITINAFKRRICRAVPMYSVRCSACIAGLFPEKLSWLGMDGVFILPKSKLNVLIQLQTKQQKVLDAYWGGSHDSVSPGLCTLEFWCFPDVVFGKPFSFTVSYSELGSVVW